MENPTSRGDEPVGPDATQMRRSYESWSTNVVIHTWGGDVKGDAHFWSNRIGPGWEPRDFSNVTSAPDG